MCALSCALMADFILEEKLVSLVLSLSKQGVVLPPVPKPAFPGLDTCTAPNAHHPGVLREFGASVCLKTSATRPSDFMALACQPVPQKWAA